MKTVFILGAGASKAAGAPLMNNFLDVAQDLLWKRDEKALKYKEQFEDVFETIAELGGVHAKSYLDLDNIESLFGAIEMGKLINKVGKKEGKAVDRLRESLITLIYVTLEQSILFPASGQAAGPAIPYRDFIYHLNEAKHTAEMETTFAFITFNYDICLEYALTSSTASSTPTALTVCQPART